MAPQEDGATTLRTVVLEDRVAYHDLCVFDINCRSFRRRTQRVKVAVLNRNLRMRPSNLQSIKVPVAASVRLDHVNLKTNIPKPSDRIENANHALRRLPILLVVPLEDHVLKGELGVQLRIDVNWIRVDNLRVLEHDLLRLQQTEGRLGLGAVRNERAFVDDDDGVGRALEHCIL